jgi:ABC-type uncharacterized transport system fused permease/ATPase subunit
MPRKHDNGAPTASSDSSFTTTEKPISLFQSFKSILKNLSLQIIEFYFPVSLIKNNTDLLFSYYSKGEESDTKKIKESIKRNTSIILAVTTIETILMCYVQYYMGHMMFSLNFKEYSVPSLLFGLIGVRATLLSYTYEVLKANLISEIKSYINKIYIDKGEITQQKKDINGYVVASTITFLHESVKTSFGAVGSAISLYIVESSWMSIFGSFIYSTISSIVIKRVNEMTIKKAEAIKKLQSLYSQAINTFLNIAPKLGPQETLREQELLSRINNEIRERERGDSETFFKGQIVHNFFATADYYFKYWIGYVVGINSQEKKDLTYLNRDGTSRINSVFRFLSSKMKDYVDLTVSSARMNDYKKELFKDINSHIQQILRGIVTYGTKTQDHLIKISNLMIKTERDLLINQGEQLELPEKGFVLFKAKSGAGKTTLFALILGMFFGEQGKNRLEKNNTKYISGEIKIGCKREEIMYIPKEGYAPFGSKLFNFINKAEPELEELAAHQKIAYPRDKLDDNDVNELPALVDHLGLNGAIKEGVIQNKKIEGSGGEIVRLSLLNAYFKYKKGDLKLLLLDEGLTTLDHDTRAKIYQFIKDKFRDILVISIEHLEEKNNSFEDELRQRLGLVSDIDKQEKEKILECIRKADRTEQSQYNKSFVTDTLVLQDQKLTLSRS